MNRRPKLDLSSDKEVWKKQPARFGKTPPGTGGTTVQDTQEKLNPEAAGATATEPQVELPEPAGWMDGKKLLKVALIVAAAGLSIYFLKRRFYP